MKNSTAVNISPKSDNTTLSISKLCSCELPPHYDQKFESSIKIDAEDLPIEKKMEGSLTITLDDNSTSSGN